MNKYEDVVVTVLTPFVYVVVLFVIVFVGLCELSKTAIQYYPNIKNWIAEKFSHMY